jgi:glutaredoxin
MEQPEITVYGAPWCPDCRQSKQFLGEQRIRFNRVNIDDDEEGRNKIQELNDVKQIIPTIVFEDGSILVEPSNADLAAKLGINHKAKRAKAIERSLSASAIVGPCLEFNSLPVVEMDEDRCIHAETDQPRSPKGICLSPTRPRP